MTASTKTTATQLPAKTVRIIWGKMLNISVAWVNPSPTLSDMLTIIRLRLENPHLATMPNPAKRMEPNIMMVQQPNTAWGIDVSTQFVADRIVALFTDDAKAIRLGGQYFRGYIWDCMFAGIHFSFSGYFCAIGKSGISFLHNILAVTLVRVPGAYFTSKLFPTTLFPMGLATAGGSLLSVAVCLIAFAILKRKSAAAEV